MDRILDNCESYDAVVIAGDILDMDSNCLVAKQIGDCLDWEKELFKRTGLTLRLGNHDYAISPFP